MGRKVMYTTVTLTINHYAVLVIELPSAAGAGANVGVVVDDDVVTSTPRLANTRLTLRSRRRRVVVLVFDDVAVEGGGGVVREVLGR